MDKNKFSHSILKYLYSKDCIGFCDIKEFLQKAGKTELEIKASVAALKENQWIETNGDWTWLGGKREGINITLEAAKLNALITERGITYYERYNKRKQKYKFWIPIIISAITLIFTAISTFNNSSKNKEIQTRQEQNEKNIKELYQTLDSLKVLSKVK